MERQTTKQKNQEHRNIATLSLQLRSYKKMTNNSLSYRFAAINNYELTISEHLV